MDYATDRLTNQVEDVEKAFNETSHVNRNENLQRFGCPNCSSPFVYTGEKNCQKCQKAFVVCYEVN